MVVNIIQVKSDSLGITTLQITSIDTSSILFWITIFELLIIIFLILKLKQNKKITDLKGLSRTKVKQAQKEDIDMDNLIESINKSRSLYKELSKYCHPDRFVKTDKQEIAEEIFKKITKYKRDFGKLSELKLRAETELNINFNKK